MSSPAAWNFLHYIIKDLLPLCALASCNEHLRRELRSLCVWFGLAGVERGHKDTLVCVLVPAGRGEFTTNIFLKQFIKYIKLFFLNLLDIGDSLSIFLVQNIPRLFRKVHIVCVFF